MLFPVLRSDFGLLANPIRILTRPGTADDLGLPILALLFAMALGAEGWLTLRMIRRSGCTLSARRGWLSFLAVHGLTYPLTLLLTRPLGPWAEVFPFTIEIWLFPILAGIATRPALRPVLMGNALSLMLGWALPRLWIQAFPFVLRGY